MDAGLKYTHWLSDVCVLLRVFDGHVNAVLPNGSQRRASKQEIEQMQRERTV